MTDTEQVVLGDLLRSGRASLKTGPFGTALKAAEYAASGVPVISVGEVGYGFLRVHAGTPRVDQHVTRRLPSYVLRAGDVVFGRKGAVDRSALIRPSEDGYFLGSDGIRARFARGIDPAYVAYQFQSDRVRTWLMRKSSGSTMASLNHEVLASVPLRLPPLSEQRYVVQVLADADDHIACLERLIAKKLAVKQGMLQQLLTGRTRLPGFAAPWSESSVHREFDVQLGKRLDAAVNVGEERLCINNRGVRWGKVLVSEAVSAPLTASDMQVLRLTKGDVLVCEGGEIGRSAVWSGEVSEVYFLNTLHRLRTKGGYDPYFFVAVLEHMATTGRLSATVGKSSLAHLTKANLMRLRVPLPSHREQESIGRVLGDVQAEVDLLDARLAKARDIKTGMMQELLAGRRRLLVEEEEA